MEIVKSFEKCDCSTPLVVGCFKGETVFVSDAFSGDLNKAILEMDLAVGKVNVVYTFDKITNKKVYVVGMGDKEKYKTTFLKTIFNKISKINEEKIIIDLKTFGDEKEVAYTATYELNYGTYQFLEFKSEKKENELEVKFLSSDDVSKEIEEALVISGAVNNARDLINKPCNFLNAIDLANYAVDLVKELDDNRVTVEIFDKSQITAMKMGAFLGVNLGSTVEPRLIYIKYQGLEKWENIIGIVGKGLMFDTGGYSIKTSMNTMKCDMAGSATALSVVEALVKNNVKCNVVMVIAATDNRINGEALLPDDVITASNGMTIEIVSTDAEGRLTLADALLFAQEKGSQEVIDIATLTGACVTALGEYTTGVFGNDKKTINKFLECTEKMDESCWELPITEHIRERVRSSKVADLINSTGPKMGASSAAAFLEAFINKDVKWLHLDIAGTAFHTSPKDNEYYGATGVMVKSIYEYIKMR